MFFFPINLPKPQQNGYTRKYEPNMLRTQMSDGYVRQRLINQGASDAISVTWIFNSEEFAEFLLWYKGNIHYGADWFVCPLLSLEKNEITYQYSRIQKGQFTQSLLFRNQETAVYKITCTLDVSSTVVDDGSWSEHYSSKGASDDGYGKALTLENTNIAESSSALKDDLTTEKVAAAAVLSFEDSTVVNSQIAIEEADEASTLASSFNTIEIDTTYEET